MQRPRFLLTRLLRKARTFSREPWWLQAGLLPVWCLLGVARAIILCIPFRRIAPHLGRDAGVASFSQLLLPAQQQRARQIRRVIETAARYTPWTSNCFPQAIVGRALLGLCGVSCIVFFGLRREAGEMKAHAWVMAGPVAVSGGHCFATFTVVGAFVSSSSSGSAA